MSLGVVNLGKSHLKSRKKKKFANKVFDYGLFLLIVLIIVYFLSGYVVERMKVRNVSMQPTLNSGDNILIDKISYRFRNPERNEIIIFRQNKTGEELIKRVIGLPGESVLIKDGIIYIDGEEYKDIKSLDKPEYAGLASEKIRLMEGEYFVLGDNREESIDSRYEEVGIVTDTRIIGRYFVRILRGKE